MTDFAGKLAIVTGAAKSNGIGFATALALARRGADIVLHYNSNAAAAETSVSKLRELGVKAIAVQADATSPTFGHDVVNATLSAFPNRKIDIIINNAAALIFQQGITDFTDESFDKSFHANVRGPLLLLTAALPHITAPGGRIVNIGSVVSRIGSGFGSIYGATKGALNSLTIAWAEELGERGITANVVSPGPIGTDNVPPEEHALVQRFRSEQQLKRNGTVEEVAEVIAFLVSDKSGFVTGQVWGVDGGLSHA